MTSASAIAHPNIAFIKYWGNRDARLRIPSNSSLSMTLAGLATRTTVTFSPDQGQDVLELDSESRTGEALQRVSAQLDLIRERAGIRDYALVVSENDFPSDAGIASSASGMAALTLAGTAAAGLELPPAELSRLARRGSGSAARSVFGGFVEWRAGEGYADLPAEQFLPPDHWALVDWIAVVEHDPKEISSTEGHGLADSSPLQPSRVRSAPERLELCKRAIRDRDFGMLAAMLELDSNMMHAVMMTSDPPLLYWKPATLEIMHAVRKWRSGGLNVAYTLDAGPTVHCVCTLGDAPEVEAKLRALPSVFALFRGYPGEAARLLPPQAP